MSSYRLLIANDVLEYLDGVKPRDRVQLRGRFLQISEFPGHYSDFQEADITGRLLDIHLFGKYAITYWTDFADHDLKILRIEPADR
jgi:hypothetical protein